jgi:aminomethyltransferase
LGLAKRYVAARNGFLFYGNDIDDTTSPLEAGLGWITKFTKEFTAKSILEKQKAEGVKNKLVGFESAIKAFPVTTMK